MNTQTAILASAAGSLLAITAGANAAITISQTAAAAPTYGTTLNFDEPGTPTGLVPQNYWQSSHGITIHDGVNGPNTVVDDFTDVYPWVGTGNSNLGTFGVYLHFDQDVTSLSFQAWDPSGAPSPFGGGMVVAVVDENYNMIEGASFTGAWGGVGKTWINLTTTGASVIRHVVIFNNSFDPYTWVDNLSWNTVPGPGGLAMFGLALLGRGRRRN